MSKLITLSSALLATILCASCQHNQESQPEATSRNVAKRIGMVIGLKEDEIDDYKELHADSHEGVRDLLNKYNMHNFSIFLQQFDNEKYYLFGYYEYTGDDFEADMAALAKEQRNKEWLSVTDPMQIPFEGEEGWTIMDQVYFNP